MKKLLLLVPFILLFSCSVQKRKYQKGFYVSSHKTITVTKKDNQPGSQKEKQSKQPVAKTVSVPQSENDNVEASVNKTIIPTKKEAPPTLLFHRDGPCDVIVLKNGVEINARILEVSPIEVKYKKCDLPDSPLYIAEKSDIFMIKYANGTKDVFKTDEKKNSELNSGAGSNSNNNNHTSVNGGKGKETHELAILALAFGIAGFVIGIGSIPAIIAGNAALRKIKAQPDRYEGEDMARIGKILGIVGLILKIFLIIVFIIFINALLMI